MSVDPAALTSATQEWDFGCDLLDDDGVFVEDISQDLTGMQVHHDVHATVHGDCTLELTRTLQWGSQRVRPWIAVRRDASEPWQRWNLGVFVPTTPEEEAGETPRTRRVQCYDLLWLLAREVGDTYVIPVGTLYLTAIQDTLTTAGVAGQLFLQGDRWQTALSEPAVWVLGGGYTWLDIINDLLGMIGYEALWCDSEGRFRSAPYMALADRPSVWTFDSADLLTTIMGEQRRLAADVFDAPNLWRFVRRTETAPTSSDVYIVDRTAGLPVYQRRPKVVYVDAEDSNALIAEGDRIVDEDTGAARVLEFDITPIPLSHGDVVTVRDIELGLSSRCLVAGYDVGPDSAHLTLEVL